MAQTQRRTAPPAGAAEQTEDEAWKLKAACRGSERPDLWHQPSRSDATKLAKNVCVTLCAVRAECLAYALRNLIEHGTWGGFSEQQVSKLVRAGHPGRFRRSTVIIRNGPRKAKT